MEFQLSTALLRPYRLSDKASICEDRLIHNPRVAQYMSNIPHPYTERDAEEWLQLASTTVAHHQFAIVRNDRVIGGIGFIFPPGGRAGVQRHTAEFGYWLGEPYWGKGIATEAATAVSNWGFQALDLVRIEAAVYHPNLASARVLEKAGFQFEGRLQAAYFKNGQFYDGLLFAKVRLPKEPDRISPAT
jgi:RimJ/RimL family protein N-acetyltransferase